MRIELQLVCSAQFTNVQPHKFPQTHSQRPSTKLKQLASEPSSISPQPDPHHKHIHTQPERMRGYPFCSQYSCAYATRTTTPYDRTSVRPVGRENRFPPIRKMLLTSFDLSRSPGGKFSLNLVHHHHLFRIRKRAIPKRQKVMAALQKGKLFASLGFSA